MPRVMVCKGDGRVKVAKPVPLRANEKKRSGKEEEKSTPHLVLPRLSLFHRDWFYDNPQPIHRLVHRKRHY